MRRYSEPAVADAYCASRLGGDSGRVLGTLALPAAALAALADRARVKG
jgi:putative acyl-CoA dehydrogenase